jgi:hypothetical protein
MTDQQPADDRDQQDPYPADQQFGKAAADDQERVDKGEKPQGASGDEPRAANKADSQS